MKKYRFICTKENENGYENATLLLDDTKDILGKVFVAITFNTKVRNEIFKTYIAVDSICALVE